MTNNDLLKMCEQVKNDLVNLYNNNPSDEEIVEAEENGVAYDLYSYISDSLNITYTLDSEKKLIGVRLMVAGGGPNIFINTVSGKIEGYWGGDEVTLFIPDEIAEAITENFEDMF